MMTEKNALFQDVSVQEALQKFIYFKNIEVGFSLKSIDAYRSDLNDFIQSVTFLHKKIHLVTQGDLEDYIASLTDRGYKTGSVARKMSVLKQFFSFLYLEKYMPQNPAQHLKHPKHKRKLPNSLTLDEIDVLIKHAGQGVFPHNLRFVALLELVYGSGLRVSELVSMPLSAISHDRDYTIITGKGNKQRLIPLTQQSKHAIDAYLPYRLFFCNNKDSLFLFPSTGRDGHLTRIRFFQILKSLAASTGIAAEKLNPHNFRHSFATDLLRGGADLKSVQNLLGHQSITTTEIYTHLCYDDIQHSLRNHHPLSDEKLPKEKI